MAGAVFKNGERVSHLPGFMGIGKRHNEYQSKT